MTTAGAGASSGRGLNVTPAEDLALARSWVSVSESVNSMDADKFWDRVASTFATQPEAMKARTAVSLRSRWSTLQRQAQKYNVAEQQYRAAIPSGESEEDTVANIMELYQQTNKVPTSSGLRPAPVFKSVEAAHLLACCPKFSTKMGGPSSSSLGRRPASNSGGSTTANSERRDGSGSDEAQASADSVAAAVPMAGPSASRPAGSKRFKKAAAQNRESSVAVDHLAESIHGVREAFSSASERRSDLAALALEANLLTMMAEGEEKQRLLRDLLNKTQRLQSASARTASGQADARTTPESGQE